jgi:dihydrofolate synthase/folylpolyglutamate synthase
LKKTYEETVDFLFSQLPVFQRDGSSAYKPGLDNIIALCEAIGNPQTKFKCIHVGGTNGKGSSSHSLAAVLQSAGYKTGLYTSPHLFDFRERIRINGEPVNSSFIVDCIETWKDLIEKIKPSFFEITVALAFKYFAEEVVDIAVIEVGMGGRLDSTNIIIPEVCLITNIGLDHQKFLGNTLQEIAAEKAGIIKHKVPVVIGEKHNSTFPVFSNAAKNSNSKLIYSSEGVSVINLGIENGLRRVEVTHENGNSFPLFLSLLGIYQLKNLKGILSTIKVLNNLGYQISNESIVKGLSSVTKLTGLAGRWQILQDKPFIVCDTGHNLDGIKEVVSQIQSYQFKHLWLIWGMVDDKDHQEIIALLPKDCTVVATQPTINRALKSEKLFGLFSDAGFNVIEKKSVSISIDFVLENADKEDFIFIGGSTFVVADIPFEKFNASD